MKVFAISDLHLSINNPKPMDIFGAAWDNYLDSIFASWQDKVCDDDAVLLAGDLSWAMTLDAALPDVELIARLKGKKVLLRGNHDYWWKSISVLRSRLPEGVYAVQNDVLRMGDVLVCGSRGWTTPEKGVQTAEDKKIYEREIIRMRLSLESMQRQRLIGDRVVAMTHFPPFNSTFSATPFTRLFTEFGVPDVVYGHLHGKSSRAEPLVALDGVNYHLTSCDLVGNRLVEII